MASAPSVMASSLEQEFAEPDGTLHVLAAFRIRHYELTSKGARAFWEIELGKSCWLIFF
jgi:hypothetical protein